MPLWKWIAAAVLIIVAVIAGRRLWRRHQTAAACLAQRQAAIAARADEQHQWYLEGDDRGTYGMYPPAPSHRFESANRSSRQ